MAEIIKMPLLSDTMTEGVVAAWHKEVGDTVSNGDLLAEIETDKATMDFESLHDGVLLHVGVEAGDAIPVGALLAVIGEKDEDISALVAAGASAPAAVEAAPAQEEAAAPASNGQEKVAETAPATASVGESGRIKASPLAKAMAKDAGIDLSTIQGSGENGRIIKRDIEGASPMAAPQPAVAQPAPATAAPVINVTSTGGYTEERVSQMRKTISRRLGESKFSAPHFYVTMEIDMDNAMKLRKQLNEFAPSKVSFNDMVVKAAAAALRQHPKLNGSWMGDVIRYHDDINIGVAVAVDDGLLVPVVNKADTKGMSTISAEVREMAGRAREKKLQPDEMSGNTFTISNLGMFGVEEFTAIINPPDVCIMAVGGIKQTPVVRNGEIVPGNIMKVTLSSDHRVVDGAMAASFLQTFKGLMEDPMRILL